MPVLVVGVKLCIFVLSFGGPTRVACVSLDSQRGDRAVDADMRLTLAAGGRRSPPHRPVRAHLRGPDQAAGRAVLDQRADPGLVQADGRTAEAGIVRLT